MNTDNLQRLDSRLQNLLGPNGTLFKIYTLQECTDKLLEARSKTLSFIEFFGIVDENAGRALQGAGFRITTTPHNGVYKVKTVISW